jgi:hypothetical protein
VETPRRGRPAGARTCICACIACSRAADARPAPSPMADQLPGCAAMPGAPATAASSLLSPMPRRSSDSARVAKPGALSIRDSRLASPHTLPPPADSARACSLPSPARCPLPTSAIELTSTSMRMASSATRPAARKCIGIQP